MRRIAGLILTLIALNAVVSCKKFPDAPLTGEHLKILAIGNSFTLDATQYLTSMIDNAGINRREVCVYITTLSGGTIDNWINIYYSNCPILTDNVLKGIKMKSVGSLKNLLAQDWDVIVFQQASDYSYDWKNYSNLQRYIDSLKSNCANPDVKIAFQQVWSRTVQEDPLVYNGNVECSRKVGEILGNEWIIPSGAAIQMARATCLNDSMYLTRDHLHLNKGIARYIVSCTWFEKLFAPVFHKTIIGNAARPDGNYSDSDIKLAQECARNAVLYPFGVTDSVMQK